MRLSLLVAALLLTASCASAPKAAPRPMMDRAGSPTEVQRRGPPAAQGYEVGIASYYASSLHGRKTASGEPYDERNATCAHRKHRFGTILQVTSQENGRVVRCRVNDRGPFVKGRIIDLSRSLAAELGMLQKGIHRVRVEPHR